MDVTLSWETASEVELVGFNLYRTPAAGGETVRVNDTVIAAVGSAEVGQQYALVDQPGQGHFIYELELVTQAGEAQRLGQVEAQVEEELDAGHQYHLPFLQSR